MGRRGPRPTPSALRELHGTAGHRARAPDEPRPVLSASTPRAPRGLSPGARKHWRKLAPDLHRAGLLTIVDLPALRCTVEALARLDEALELYERDGVLERVPRARVRRGQRATYVRITAAARFVRQAEGEARRWLAEFGLTPARRITAMSAATAAPAAGDVGNDPGADTTFDH